MEIPISNEKLIDRLIEMTKLHCLGGFTTHSHEKIQDSINLLRAEILGRMIDETGPVVEFIKSDAGSERAEQLPPQTICVFGQHKIGEGEDDGP